MYALLLPTLASAFGFVMTGVFAFAFSDIGVIPASVQSWMVIFGSALIIWGAEMNTPFVFIEAFRKVFRKEHHWLDIMALACSLVGTGANLLVAFASRMNAPAWQTWALTWGPVVGGLAVVLDYYGAGVEVGFLFGSYEDRYDTWLKESVAFEKGKPSDDVVKLVARYKEQKAELEEVNAEKVQIAAEAEKMRAELARLDRPVCSKEEFFEQVESWDGEMTRVEAVDLIDSLGRNLPHVATLARWLTELNGEGVDV